MLTLQSLYTQFYSMVLDSRMDDFSLEEKSRRRNFSLSPLYDLTDVCLGCVTNTRSAEEDNSNNMDVDEEDTFAEFFKVRASRKNVRVMRDQNGMRPFRC